MWTYPTFIWHPIGYYLVGISPWFWRQKTRVPGLSIWRCLCDPRFSHLCTSPTCDRQTDRSRGGGWGCEVMRWHRAATQGAALLPLQFHYFFSVYFLYNCCFTDSTYRHILFVRSSFCFQLVLGLPPPPSIRAFELYGPGTVFAVHRCHLGRTGTYHFYFSNISFYFILFLFQT